jgi:hypothetical protein
MAHVFHRNKPVLAGVVSVLFGSGIVSSLSVAPHSLSYFNEAVGGPIGGRHHLLDGNLDWGQNLLRLKEWANAHPEAKPLRTALTTSVPLDAVGIDAMPYRPENQSKIDPLPLKPGWYAIGVNNLMGYRLMPNTVNCSKFQHLNPVETIGYTIHVYHVKAAH